MDKLKSNIDLESAKNQFLDLMRKLEKSDKHRFLQWISDEWQLEDINNDTEKIEELKAIAAILRKKVPLSGIMPSESLHVPTNATLKDREYTIHVDEFLYDDSFLPELAESKKVPIYKCCKCGSNEIEELEMISHSCSIDRLKCIFRKTLPDLKGKTLLDVGSRIGAVIFGAYFLSDAEKIIGIEINKEFCQLTKEIATERNMLDRIEIINDNILNQPECVRQADVTVINNAFQHFTTDSVASECWKFLRASLKPGSLVVMCPLADDDFSKLLGESWSNWLLEVSSEDDDFPEMGMYKVKP